MKKILLFSISSALLMLGLMIGTPSQFAQADNSGETPPEVSAAASGNVQTQLAEAPPPRSGGNANLGAIYQEFRDLTKKYRQAKGQDAKERIHARMQELMGQLFDAKVQMERRRLQAAEEKIAKEKRRLSEMQNHKQDMVHKGVQKVLKEGQLPEWVPKRNEPSQQGLN